MRSLWLQAFKSYRAATAQAASGAAGAVKSVELDPWAVESSLVQELKHLGAAQARQRDFVQAAFEQLSMMEIQRLAMQRKTPLTVALQYQGLREDLDAALQGCGGTQEYGSSQDASSHAAELLELQRLCRAAGERGGVEEQQKAVLASALQDLFSSPDIIRQGAMQCWDPHGSNWLQSHFVLTHAGGLHWWRGTGPCSQQVDAVPLANCQFEQGKAPVFNITESTGGRWLGGRERKHTFQALSIEDCCEWTIAIREAMSRATAK